MTELAILGNFAMDDLVFADGRTHWNRPGGSALYAGLGAAVWGQPVSLVAPLSDDYPTTLLQGMNCVHCRAIPHTMRNWGLYEEDGTRHFISRSRDRDWISFCSEIADLPHTVRAAHLAPMPTARALDLAMELRRRGTACISIDVDDHDLSEQSVTSWLDLLQTADLFLPSEQEVRRLFPGVPMVHALGRLREQAPSAHLIAIKCGARGVLAHVLGSKDCVVVPSAARQVIDVTGAGDAFCGGLLAGYATGAAPVHALLQGSLAAAWCIEQDGCRGLVGGSKQEGEVRLQWEKARLGSMPLPR